MNHKGVRLPAALLAAPETCQHVLVCLPYQGVPILLSLTERLEWATTWINEDGTQAALSDTDRATIDAIIGGLNCPMCTDAIVNAIDALRQEIANVQIITNNNISTNCGCDGTGGVTIIYPPDATPENPYLPPLTSDEIQPFIDVDTGEPNPALPLADGQTMDEKRCLVANQVWYDIYRHADIAEFLVGVAVKIAYIIEILTGISIASKVASKFGGSVIADIGANLLEMLGVDSGMELVFDGAKNYLEDNQQDIVCQLYNSPDLESYQQLTADIIQLAYNSAASAVLSELKLPKFAFLVERLANIYKSIVAYYWTHGDNDYSPPAPIDCALCSQVPSGYRVHQFVQGQCYDNGVAYNGELLAGKIYQYQSAITGSYSDADIVINSVVTGNEANCTFTIHSVDGWVSSGSVQSMRVSNAADQTIFSLNMPNPPVPGTWTPCSGARILGGGSSQITVHFSVQPL